MPSGLNATLNTEPVWPVSGCPMGWPVLVVPHPHRAVVAAGGDAFPSGLNATQSTGPVWPVSGCPMGWPVLVSHTRTVWS